ncbi:MAG: asparagine synthase (glutamine-hydrolyzing) [Vicinamibacterales bacterium]
MCGIAGLVEADLARPVSRPDVEPMVQAIVHRGPDEDGYALLDGVGLGMRRLSIIDLSTGQQPFSNETGDIQLVANGEIYNQGALREELLARGHTFRSHSDIETIVHGYETWGEDVFTRLRGMFAIALWDGRARTLLLARDRAGEKPLFWTLTPQGLRFGSEMKALLARPEVRRALDPEALDQFLTYEYVITPRTILKGIQKVPPGSFVRYRDGGVSVHRYWDVAAVAPRAWKDADAIEAVRETVKRAVVGQMMSDVPLGAFLSGGVDSSTIVAFMSQATSLPVNTFSMGFDDGSYNELPFAREVAQLFGTHHRERVVSPAVGELFDRLVTHLDEPFADVSMFPTFMVSRLAREHVAVALSGDGGDELFGGYDAYEAQAAAERLGRVGNAVLPIAAAVTAMIRPQEQKKGLVNGIKRFVQGAATAPADIGHYRWMTYLGSRGRRRLYSAGLQEALRRSDVYQPVRDVLRRYSHDEWLNRQLYADLTIYLADDILVKVDRMSMATSLETRAPFLDVDVMELAFSMRGDLKVRKGERKWVLKRAVEGLIPASILDRRKQGFSIPIKNWLKRELQPLMRELLSPDRIARRGLFEPVEVARLMDDHVAGRENHAHILFPLMVLERWAQHHLR